MSEMDLAKSLFGASTAREEASATSSVRYGTAVADSSGGKVELLLDGNADGTATVTLSCDVEIASGDRVKVVCSGGRYLVYSLGTQVAKITSGIAAASEEAAAALGKAEQAQSEAAEAAEEAASASSKAEQAQSEAASAAEEAASATEKAEAAQAGTSTAVTSVDVEFAISASSATAPESGWQTTAPTAEEGECVWQRTKVETPSGTTYTEPFCLTTYAAAGADGVGVESITEQYYLSASSTTQAGGSWTAEYPGWEEDKYLWTRSVIAYTDGSSTQTDPVCVSGAPGADGEDGEDGQMLYATSGTGASTAAKEATLATGTLTLSAGATVAVTFSYANAAASPTLDVSGTGAKAIRTNGTASAYWEAGATVAFAFDGSYWQVASTPVYASTATVGNGAAANVHIDADSVDCRTGTTVHSSFSGDGVELYDGSGNLAADFATESCNFYQGGTLGASVNSDGFVAYADGNMTAAMTASGTTLYDSDGNQTASFAPSGCDFYQGGTLGTAVNSSGFTAYNASGYRTLATTSGGLTVYSPTSATGATPEAAFTASGVTLYADGAVGSSLTGDGLVVYSGGNPGAAFTASGVTFYDPSDGSTVWATFAGDAVRLARKFQVDYDEDSYKAAITNYSGGAIEISASGVIVTDGNVNLPGCTAVHTESQTVSSATDETVTMGDYTGASSGLLYRYGNAVYVGAGGSVTPNVKLSGFATFANAGTSAVNAALALYHHSSYTAGTDGTQLAPYALATVPAGGYATVALPQICCAGTGYYYLRAHCTSGSSLVIGADNATLTATY